VFQNVHAAQERTTFGQFQNKQQTHNVGDLDGMSNAEIAKHE
jgi:hypothetical protein